MVGGPSSGPTGLRGRQTPAPVHPADAQLWRHPAPAGRHVGGCVLAGEWRIKQPGWSRLKSVVDMLN